MFVQTIQGHVSDAEELKECLDAWMKDLSPGAMGWLGSTGGVTDGGDFVGVVRFDSAEAARRNSERAEQHQWWMETSKLFSGEVVFHDCPMVERFGDGGADDAGFVQVMEGRVSDVARMRELGQRMEAAGMGDFRTDVIGGTVAFHEDEHGYTMTMYFTSEEAARTGERKEPPANLAAILDEERALHLGPPAFLDLHHPWLHSPG